MQRREFSIMADLSDKHNIKKNLSVLSSIEKRHLTNQNAIAVKK